MATLSLSSAQRFLLGIITSIESGLTTPEQAVKELEKLKAKAPSGFNAEYTLEDFQRIATENVDFITSESYVAPEGPYESSY